MKKIISTSFIICIALLTTVFMYSCSIHEEIDEISLDEQKTRLENGYLVFADEATFENQILINNRLSEEELESWERSLGFSSMLTFYNEAMTEEILFFESMEVDRKVISQVLPHSDFVNKNAPFLSFDSYGMIDLNSYRAEAASILSKEGFVKVGEVLYQYSRNQLKSFYKRQGESITAQDLEMVSMAPTSLSNETYELMVSPVTYLPVLPGNENARNDFEGHCAAPYNFVRLSGSLWLSTVTYLGISSCNLVGGGV